MPVAEAAAPNESKAAQEQTTDSGPPTDAEILAQVAAKAGASQEPEQKAPPEDAHATDAPDAADEGETEEQEETEEASTEQETGEEIPVELITQAAQFGLSAEDCAELGSAAAVVRAMTIAHRTWQMANNRQQPQQTAEENTTPQPDAVDAIIEKMVKSGIDEEYAGQLKELVAALRGAVKNEIGQLQQTVTTLTEKEKKRNDDEFTRQCDRVFRKMGKDQPELFGKGNFWQLNDKNIVANRQKVAQRAVALMNAENADLSQLDEYLELAADSVFKKQRQEWRTKQAIREAQKEREQTIPTPSHRKPGGGTAVKTDEELIAWANEKYGRPK